MTELPDRVRTGGDTGLTALAAEQETRLIKTLRRGDIVLFIVAAVISVDTIGVMASGGPEGLLWAIFLAAAFLVPSAMIFAETGGAFTEEGGPYQWVKYAFGRSWAAIAVVLYWITNPIWLGGSLVFIASEVWNQYVFGIEPGSAGDYLFKLIFIWVAITLAIVSLQKGKTVISAGAIAKLLVLISLVTTAVIYGFTEGFEPITLSSLTPTTGGFLAIVPIALFAYLGFESPNSAAGEMHNPQKDVPAAIRRGSVITMLAYVLPVLAIIWATPADEIADAGVMAALERAYSVYGPAAGFLTVLTALMFVFALLTQGSAWMMATDRMQAMAAADGSFFGGFFGEFHRAGDPGPNEHLVGRGVHRVRHRRFDARRRHHRIGLRRRLDRGGVHSADQLPAHRSGSHEAPQGLSGCAPPLPRSRRNYWLLRSCRRGAGVHRAGFVGRGLPRHHREPLWPGVLVPRCVGRFSTELRGIHHRHSDRGDPDRGDRILARARRPGGGIPHTIS